MRLDEPVLVLDVLLELDELHQLHYVELLLIVVAGWWCRTRKLPRPRPHISRTPSTPRRQPQFHMIQCINRLGIEHRVVLRNQFTVLIENDGARLLLRSLHLQDLNFHQLVLLILPPPHEEACDQ